MVSPCIESLAPCLMVLFLRFYFFSQLLKLRKWLRWSFKSSTGRGVDMNNMAEIVQAVFIGLLVARFLLNTCRVLKAIELCKECLVTLNNKAFEDKDTLTKTIYKDVYQTMSRAYFLINNYTGAFQYARKLLAIHRELGERFEESQLSIVIANWCYRQRKFVEAKELYQRALSITVEIYDKKGEASC
ncbi:uncharacterized protein LOC144656555 [Oculina patagonica]